jgi:hypothetical protein
VNRMNCGAMCMRERSVHLLFTAFTLFTGALFRVNGLKLFISLYIYSLFTLFTTEREREKGDR